MYFPNEIFYIIKEYLPCKIYQRQRHLKKLVLTELEYRKNILHYIPISEYVSFLDVFINIDHSIIVNLIFLSLKLYPLVLTP